MKYSPVWNLIEDSNKKKITLKYLSGPKFDFNEENDQNISNARC